LDDLKFLHQQIDSPLDDLDGQKDGQKNKQIRPLQVVVVEDDHVFAKALKFYFEHTFRSDFFHVHHFSSPAQCLENISSVDFSGPVILLTDIAFDSGVDGLLLIDLMREKGLNFVAICMTGFASIETAINATKKGVSHYLTKPFKLEALKEILFNVLVTSFSFEKQVCHEYLRLSQTAQSLNKDEANTTQSPFFVTTKTLAQVESPKEDDKFLGMIGRSKKMRQLFERIKKVANSNSTVLIQGASGTGKELVAKAIHNLSDRAPQKLVSVNCGAIPADLLESELFGHIKGAFTGAISDRKGRFELANKGSIFLDEIGDMPLLLQVKLLRVLQGRQIEPVGSSYSIDVDVRIITATHKDVEKLVQDGNFREDLYYRLNVIPLKVPSLCERKEDIPLLISYFLDKYSSADGRNRIRFDPKAVELLMKYDWPGNVRELENLIERLVILKAGGVIKASDLPAKILSSYNNISLDEHLVKLPDLGIDLNSLLGQIEDSLIFQALEKTKGNKNQASKLLSLNRTTLIERMKKKGIPLDFTNAVN
jgi:two-component system response regulator PilR (NtrC family)